MYAYKLCVIGTKENKAAKVPTHTYNDAARRTFVSIYEDSRLTYALLIVVSGYQVPGVFKDPYTP
jgi:hypothetical protein